MDTGGRGPQDVYVALEPHASNDIASRGRTERLRTVSDVAVSDIVDRGGGGGDLDSSNSMNAVAKKKLVQASLICATFMVIEIIAGVLANSLALITDASHLLSDLSSFLISLFALWVSGLPGTRHLSFGYHRAEILGALTSVVLIWILTVFLVIEAFNRMMAPKPVNGFVMFITAFCGTVANVVMTYILGVHSHGIGGQCNHGHDHDHHHDDVHSHDHTHGDVEDHPHHHIEDVPTRDNTEPSGANLEEVLVKPDASFPPQLVQNVNLRAAYIHALGDLIQNIGVLIAAGLIWYDPAWTIADPICTLLFSILVLATTVTILRDATNVLMEGTPREIDMSGLREDLAKIDHVIDLHDLHVWSLSVGKPSLACHMVIDSEEEARRVLRVATRICQKKYGILHTTIQTDFSANKLACDTDAHAKCHP